MNTKGEKKLKSVNNADNIHQTIDCRRIVDVAGLVTNKTFNLSICLKPQDDFPHPRNLCFAYLFGKSSAKKHCIKCYCYVCEKIAPCKNWNNTSKRHCDGTEKDAKWILEKKLNSGLPGSTTMQYHKLTVIGTYFNSGGLELPLHGCGGGLICNNNGEWIYGISMHLRSTFEDLSAPFYRVLLGALQLAWSRGFRYLEVKLGYAFQEEFWNKFTRDAVTRKFHLCNPCSSAVDIRKDVEGYLNREWFICVKYTDTYEEESGAIMVSSLSKYHEQAQEVHDFITYPVDSEAMTREFMSKARVSASKRLNNNASANEKKYYGLN